MKKDGTDAIATQIAFENAQAKAEAFDLITKAMDDAGFGVAELSHIDTARLLLSLTFDDIDAYLKTLLASATKSFVDVIRMHDKCREYVVDVGTVSETLQKDVRAMQVLPQAFADLSSRLSAIEQTMIVPKRGKASAVTSNTSGDPVINVATNLSSGVA